MYRIHKSIDVSMAHHVRGHPGACINVHGHTWKLEVGLSAETLDKQGFVIDFGVLRSKLLMPCFRLLDHALSIGTETFLETQEALARLGSSLIHSQTLVHGYEHPTERPELILNGAKLYYPGKMKVCVFPFNPTSERLAGWLYGLAEQELADDRVQVDFARVYETLHPVESVAEYVKKPPLRE